MTESVICPIWGTPAHRVQTDNLHLPTIYSPRTDGEYRISSDQRSSINELLSNDRAKARLTTWMINQRSQGEPRPNVTRKSIEAAKDARDMSVLDRMNQILLFLGHPHNQSPMDGVRFNPDPQIDSLDPDSTNYYQLLAFSESVKWESDLRLLIDHLVKNGLIYKTGFTGEYYRCTLEMLGFERLEKLRPDPPDSNQIFVAMWFDDELKPAYDDGFKRAIEGAGYKPVRIDEQHFTDKIDDRIISEIRRSRFVVADFSKGDDGARGGVYYEAGFAHGLGLEVIFTCRKKDIDDVHFDTRQYNHIVWENIEHLQNLLKERITAVIGDGPYKVRV